MKDTQRTILALLLAFLLAFSIAGPFMLSSGQFFLPDHVAPSGMSMETLERMTRNIGPSFAPSLLFALIAEVFGVALAEKLFLLLILLLPILSGWLYLRRKVGDTLALSGGTLLLLNPFMYERFMAGQWFVVLGVGFLPLFLLSLERLLARRDRRSALLFTLAFSVFPLFSLHLAYIGTAFGVLYALLYVALHRDARPSVPEVGKAIAAALMGFVFLNSFWLFGFFGEGRTFSAIDERDLQSFVTKGDPTIGLIPNVALGYGFWRDEGVILPKDVLNFWYLPGALLLALAFLGAYLGARRRETLAVAALFAAPLALVLAAGYGSEWTANFAHFAFSYVPGFAGLRDTAKLVGLIAFLTAMLAPEGAAALIRIGTPNGRWHRALAAGGLIVLAASTSFTFFWGAMGQIKMHEYPPSWMEADVALLGAEGREKVLVFPWRGYLSLDFADGAYTANPANAYFSVPLEVSRSTGNVMLDEKYQTPYDPILSRILDVPAERPLQIEALRAQGITHVLLLKTADWERYLPFLSDETFFEALWDGSDAAIYRLR